MLLLESMYVVRGSHHHHRSHGSRHRRRGRHDHDDDFERKQFTPFADTGPSSRSGHAPSPSSSGGLESSSINRQSPHNSQEREDSVDASQSSVRGAFADAGNANDDSGTSDDDDVAPIIQWHEVTEMLKKINTDGIEATFLMRNDGILLASALVRSPDELTESNLKKAAGGTPNDSEAKTPPDDSISSAASSLTSTPFTTPMPTSRPGASGSVIGAPPPDYASRRDSNATIPAFQPHSYGTSASVMDFRDIRSPTFSVDNRIQPQRRTRDRSTKRTPEGDRELRGIVAQLWHRYIACARRAFGGQNLMSLCFEQENGIVYVHHIRPFLLLMYAAKNTPLGLMRVKAEELALILGPTLVSVYDEWIGEEESQMMSYDAELEMM